MKSYLHVLGLFGFIITAYGQQQLAHYPQQPNWEVASWQVRDIGQDHTTWEQVALMTNTSGRIRTFTNSYVELETSCRYWDGQAFQETREEIELVRNGAIAQRGPHKVGFASGIDPAMPYSLEVLTPDDKRLRFKVVGLYLYDFTAKKYALVADIKESWGELVVDAANQVVYPDAFNNVKADIRYTYTKAGLEQDIILRERSDSLMPELYGFNPASTRLLCYTEVVDAPKNVKTVQHLRKGWTNAAVSKVIDFGTMKIGHGSAFGAEAARSGIRAPVQKHWLEFEGRSYIVEEVRFPDLQPMLRDLQAGNSTIRTNESRYAVTSKPSLPAIRLAGSPQHKIPEVARVGNPAGSEMPTRTLLAARNSSAQPGVVIDFNLQSGSGWILQGDTTYLVTGNVNLTNAILEGGAVIKYNTNSQLNLYSFESKTAPYRPLICTAKDDNSVGATVSGSTGTPTGYYANRALALHTGGTLEYVHIRFAKEGIYCANNDYAVNNAQFVYCERGFQSESAWFTNCNILMSEVMTNFSGVHFYGRVEHLTADQARVLTYDPQFHYMPYCGGEPSSSLTLVNSLTTAITNGYGNVPVYVTATRNYFDRSGVFQPAGAGSYYLVSNSTNRDAGSLSIQSDLASQLRRKTTWPPVIVSNVTLNGTSIWSPVAQRDTDLPDLGYHYEPIDYAICSLSVQGGTLSLSNGVVVAMFCGTPASGAIAMQDSTRLSSIGRPTQPNRFVWSNSVQDKPVQQSGPWSIRMIYANRGDLTFRFTDFSQMPGGAAILGGDEQLGNILFRDCRFQGSEVTLGAAWIDGDSFAVEIGNCLFERTSLSAYGGYSEFHLTGYNNLFWNNTIQVEDWTSDEQVSVAFSDNIFYNSTISVTENISLIHQNNAYLTNCARLPGIGTSDVILQDPILFVTGPLGSYYQPANSPLVDVGSRQSGMAGLFHYTTQMDQTNEGISPVDIGLHYVATDGTTTPLDYDGDGVPDWQEDVNGDGDPYGDPTSWTNYNSLNGLTGGSGLQVFTPIKE